MNIDNPAPVRLLISGIIAYLLACFVATAAAFLLPYLIFPVSDWRNTDLVVEYSALIFFAILASCLLPSLLFVYVAWKSRWHHWMTFVGFGIVVTPISFLAFVTVRDGKLPWQFFKFDAVLFWALLLIMGLAAGVTFWLAFRSEWRKALSTRVAPPANAANSLS